MIYGFAPFMHAQVAYQPQLLAWCRIHRLFIELRSDAETLRKDVVANEHDACPRGCSIGRHGTPFVTLKKAGTSFVGYISPVFQASSPRRPNLCNARNLKVGRASGRSLEAVAAIDTRSSRPCSSCRKIFHLHFLPQYWWKRAT